MQGSKLITGDLKHFPIKPFIQTWSGIENYNKNIMIDDSIAINVTFINVNSAR